MHACACVCVRARVCVCVCVCVLFVSQLVDSKARIVTVSSVKHRTVRIRDARAFLTDWRAGYYEYTKLADLYFAYELQRRLGLRGVTSCAADPGGVRSNIWSASPVFQKGFYRCVGARARARVCVCVCVRVRGLAVSAVRRMCVCVYVSCPSPLSCVRSPTVCPVQVSIQVLCVCVCVCVFATQEDGRRVLLSS